MSYTGYVQNGVVVFDGPNVLPDGTAVVIAVRTTAPPPTDQSLTHYERYREVIGAAVGLPSDFAENHDHYIHGTPQR